MLSLAFLTDLSSNHRLIFAYLLYKEYTKFSQIKQFISAADTDSRWSRQTINCQNNKVFIIIKAEQ